MVAVARSNAFIRPLITILKSPFPLTLLKATGITILYVSSIRGSEEGVSLASFDVTLGIVFTSRAACRVGNMWLAMHVQCYASASGCSCGDRQTGAKTLVAVEMLTVYLTKFVQSGCSTLPI